jgi:flagellar assembly protein FliH
MTQTNANKFKFDTVFGRPGEPVTDIPRNKVYSQNEVEKLRADAHAEGAQGVEVQAMAALAAASQRAAEAIAQALADVQAEIEAVREDASMLALAIARKLAPAAVAHLPTPDVEQVLREAMHQAIGEPRITLRANPRVADELRERIESIAHEEGFEGRVQISADPAQAGADCRIEWRGGGAERNLAAIDRTLSELIARRFSNPSLSSEE